VIRDLQRRFDEAVPRDTSSPDRVYFARKPFRHRRLTNAAAVEQIARECGFHVAYPEDLPFRTQAALAREARVVVAPEGSALFLTMFCRPGATVCILSHPITDLLADYNGLLSVHGIGVIVITGPADTVSGWIFSTAEPITHVIARMGESSQVLPVGLDRPDVSAAYPSIAAAARSGFHATLNFTSRPTRATPLELGHKAETRRVGLHADAGVVEARDDRDRVVVRAVVDDDELEILEGLRQDACQGLLDVGSTIPGRHGNGDTRLPHCCVHCGSIVRNRGADAGGVPL
jgi:hypothetical protein